MSSSEILPKDRYFIPDQNTEFGIKFPEKPPVRNLNYIGKIVRWYRNEDRPKWQQVAVVVFAALALLTLTCTVIGIYFVVKCIKENQIQAEYSSANLQYETFMKKELNCDPKEEERLKFGTVDRLRKARDEVINLVKKHFCVLGYHLSSKANEICNGFLAPEDLPYPIVQGMDKHKSPFIAFTVLNKLTGKCFVQTIYQARNITDYNWYTTAHRDTFNDSIFRIDYNPQRIDKETLEIFLKGENPNYEIFCDDSTKKFYKDFTANKKE